MIRRPAAALSALLTAFLALWLAALAAGTASSLASPRGTLRTLGLANPRNGIVLAPRGYPDFEAVEGIRRESIAPEVVATQRAGVGALGLDAELLSLIVPLAPTSSES